MAKFNVFTYMIKHAQISSRIYTKLLSVKSSQQKHEDLVRATDELNTALSLWRESLPTYLHPGSRIKRSTLPDGVHLDAVVYMHYAYYGTLIAIYNRYPWTQSVSSEEETPEMHQYTLESTSKVVNAARNIILATKWIDVDMNTSGR